jgi:hypothetical protein
MSSDPLSLSFAFIISQTASRTSMCHVSLLLPSVNSLSLFKGSHLPLSVNKGQCYGCGSNMKHPNADAYNGGHSKDFKFFHIGDGCRGPNIDTAKTMDDVSIMVFFPAT